MSLPQDVRTTFVIPWTVFAGALTAVGTETTKDELSIFTVPQSGVIRAIQGCYVNEGGTTPAIDITLERGTTVLATLTQLTTDETSARVKDLSIRVSEGDILNIKGAAANTDNTFEGLLVILEYQPLADL